MTEGRRRVTLATLAGDLGVSRATVSNAYNRPDQLGVELRQRILARAQELGFSGPDPVARALRRQRVGAVGVLLAERLAYAFADPASVLILDGLARELGPAGFALLLLAGDDERPVREAAVDAFVAQSIGAEHPFVVAAVDRGLPLVVLDQPDLPGVPRVAVDDAGGTRAAMQHLLALGHRRIAVLSLPLCPDGTSGLAGPDRQAAVTYLVTRERLAGAREASTAAGQNWSGVPVYECSRNDQDVAAEMTRTALRSALPPTAIMAFSDQLALGALRSARELGIPVPSRLSVTGFDDVPAASAADPPLTTVHQPLRERGQAVGALLGALLRGGPVQQLTTFPVELRVRASTAAPRGGVPTM
jgi:DNA-binding LacI/PurR family transcriptional regulator